MAGIGPKTAARLLEEFGSASAAFDDAAGDGARCVRAVGRATARRLADPAARETWEHNRRVMTMQPATDLGLDLPAGVGCLPLREEAVRATYARMDLHVPSAVRALTGREVPAPQPRDVDAGWVPRARRVTMRHPPLPKPVEPAYVQETLF